jgi:hypothetical protein
MNIENHENTAQRPIGYWLRIVDDLISREFATALEGEGVSRGDWMILNVLAGDVDAPGFAQRMARRGKRPQRLADIGWVVETADGWQLTDDGRAAKDRLAGIVGGVRERVAGAVSPEDFATTTATLEAIARGLGWDEDAEYRRGFGPAGRHGFGPVRRWRWGHRGPAAAGERGMHDRSHHHERPEHDHPHGRRDRCEQRAFERGFDAGFARGRDVA